MVSENSFMYRSDVDGMENRCNMKALDDIAVLDVTQVLSGPFASMMLADLGADVVKIENPTGGDIGRSNPPYVGGFSAYFSILNRNKESLALDLTCDEGRELFLELAANADVIVENYTPGRMRKFGIDYETVREHNEDIVYCSITGFGQSGPYADYPALDVVVQAMSGNMSITGPPTGEPYRSGIPIADIAGSMYAVQSVVSALYHRTQTGEGQRIDVSMLDGLLSWLTVRAGYTFGTGDPYPRMGNELEEFVPYGIFETNDSHIAIVAASKHHWEGLCEALGRLDWLEKTEFKTIDDRRENREQLRSALEYELQHRTSAEWFEVFADHEVPAGPVYDTKEVWEDDHVKYRNLLKSISVGDQSLDVLTHPVEFSAFDSEIDADIPELGEDTEWVLKGIGYSEADIASLRSRGTIYTDGNE